MRFLALLFCIVAATASVQNANNAETHEVHTPAGKIRGSVMKTRLGKKIYSFRGVRFAEAPVGERRFKQAVPSPPWKDVFDATQEGPSCPQPGGRQQSEDCLHLNVYTTELPSADPSKGVKSKKPVIVFFHPGVFYYFSGQSLYLGPQYIMDQDIVLVTVNFRLASLGFLATGDANAPGNLGLKDQVTGLRWVQKNIASFGGDQNSVTIVGYSSGSSSVGLHLLSPMSKGLFHRAIGMSGSVVNQERLPNHQMNIAKKQAEFVGCPSNNSSVIIECLKTKDAIEIAATLPKFKEWYDDPMNIWSPVVEPEVPGVERFLSADPADLIRQGKFQHVPFIGGITRIEFDTAVDPIVEAGRKGNTTVIDELNANWNKIAPIRFSYERDTPRSNEISTNLKKFYFKGQPISLSNIEGYGHIYSDALIIFGVHRFTKLLAQASTAPVYAYEFAYLGRYSHATRRANKKPVGVGHHDDLLYLFFSSFFPYYEENAPELPTMKRMTSMWSNFAKTGEPIPRDNDMFANVTWVPYTVENAKYLEINTKLVMKTHLYGDRMNEWERNFPLKPLPKNTKS